MKEKKKKKPARRKLLAELERERAPWLDYLRQMRKEGFTRKEALQYMMDRFGMPRSVIVAFYHRHRLELPGEKPYRKVTVKEKQAIKRLFGNRTAEDIARKLGVSYSQVNYVLSAERRKAARQEKGGRK